MMAYRKNPTPEQRAWDAGAAMRDAIERDEIGNELATIKKGKAREDMIRNERARLRAEAGRIQFGSDFIGERQTPRKSVWPMRDKWKKYGSWFSYIGRDGDVKFLDKHGPILPMPIQLFYIVLPDGHVEQLAWERFDLYQKWVDHGKEPTLDIIGENESIKFL
jgi:hypothetical protein